VDRVPRQWRFNFWWALVPLAILFLISLFFGLDGVVSGWISAHQDAAMRSVMRSVSRFGDWIEHFVLGLILLATAWWRGNKKWTRVFLSMLIALSLAGVTGRVLKIATGRARPSVKTEHVWNGPRLSSKYHAFPSGHAAASTAFFGVLFLMNWRLGLACLPIPLLISLSRLYLGAHYSSDVVFGAMLGLVTAYFVLVFIWTREFPPESAPRQAKS
jgi:membrane-associated phospholipid phosphatase